MLGFSLTSRSLVLPHPPISLLYCNILVSCISFLQATLGGRAGNGRVDCFLPAVLNLMQIFLDKLCQNGNGPMCVSETREKEKTRAAAAAE